MNTQPSKPGKRQKGKTPVPKVTAATTAAATSTIIVVLISLATGKDIPAGVEGAIATVLAFAAGYLVPND